MGVVARATEPSGRRVALQPHQKLLQRHVPTMRFPFYIYWGMGSGKTIGGCVCMQRLGDGESCLVLCDKSTVHQWVREVQRMLTRNASDFADIRVRVEHYEAMEHADGPRPERFAMVILDEAHRFRNAWEKQSARMLRWMRQIRAAPAVVYMSGTPIVHDGASELRALRNMMGEDMRGRISHYSPRDDSKRCHHYARTTDTVVRCPMSWAQCFSYLQSRKQTFSLHLEGEPAPRVRVSSTRNTYNSLLRSICNCPFPSIDGSSSKVTAMVRQVDACSGAARKQVVYSSRRDTGIVAFTKEWMQTTGRCALKIDGSMTKQQRDAQIAKFNRPSFSGVLCITDAAGQGVDLKGANAVHIMEPADNEQEERQVVNRAVRFKAHSGADPTVDVYRYVSAFPDTAAVGYPWKKLIYESGLFDKAEMRGVTRKVQYALIALINEEEGGLTVDERVLRSRAARAAGIAEALSELQRASIEAQASLPQAARPSPTTAPRAR